MLRTQTIHLAVDGIAGPVQAGIFDGLPPGDGWDWPQPYDDRPWWQRYPVIVVPVPTTITPAPGFVAPAPTAPPAERQLSDEDIRRIADEVVRRLKATP